MVKTLVHYSRTQWASGQGFFHSGWVSVDQVRFRYVYDCGSWKRGPLNREIDEYRARHGDEIDLLFLSHFDVDHVNGVERLLKGATVHTAVVPLLPPSHRLFSLVRAEIGGQGATDWYRNHISDPVATLNNMDAINNVVPITVEPERSDAERELPTYGPARDSDVAVDEDRRNVRIAPGPRTLIYIEVDGIKQSLWEWSSLLLSTISAQVDVFLDALALNLGTGRDVLAVSIQDPAYTVYLVRNKVRELKDAYKQVSRNLNPTSLVVFSGPSRVGQTFRTVDVRERGEVHAWEVLPGWLGTGDQEMGASQCAEMSDHFGDRLSCVGSLALPHHGSRHDFSSNLLAAFLSHKPVCSASVSSTRRYGHPHSEVVLAVSSNGNHIVVVTDEEKSRWTEAGVIHFDV